MWLKLAKRTAKNRLSSLIHTTFMQGPRCNSHRGMKLSKTSNPQISEYFASNQRTTCSTFPMLLVHNSYHSHSPSHSPYPNILASYIPSLILILDSTLLIFMCHILSHHLESHENRNKTHYVLSTSKHINAGMNIKFPHIQSP